MRSTLPLINYSYEPSSHKNIAISALVCVCVCVCVCLCAVCVHVCARECCMFNLCGGAGEYWNLCVSLFYLLLVFPFQT